MESNLPATRDAADPEVDRPTLAPSRPLTVALLPLAIATFAILAITIATWSFLAAAT